MKLLLAALLLINLSTSAQNVPSYLPTDGLVGWWPFSGNAIDSSATGNNGTVYKAVLSTDRFGKLNAAYSFNGVDSRIDVPDAASLRCSLLTVSVWVYNNDIARISQVIYKGSLNADAEAYSVYCINNFLGSGVKIASNCVPNEGWKGTDCKQQATQGSWENLVTTYDGTTYKQYKNGVLDTTVAISGLMDACVGGGLRFGYNHTRYSTSNGDGFNGMIDDIGIWNKALTANQVTKLYSAGLAECGAGNLGVNVCTPQRSLHVKDVLRLEPRSFSPPNPAKGDIYFDGTTNKLRVYDGTSWKDCW
jgi:hypothetical protein